MTASLRRRRKVWLSVALVATSAFGGLALTGCAPSVDSRAEYIMTRTLPADVTAKGVVLAAVLLASGDIDNAVGNGIVTPAEVDTAKTAIDQDLLDFWAQRAEKDAAQ